MRHLNYQKIESTIISSLQKYIGDKKVFIGISGGIDSAVTASLCVKALGSDKVFGLLMPFGRQLDIKDSLLMVKKLKIKSFKVNIKAIVNQFKNFDNKFVLANIMARVRMILLYSYANAQNALVIGTTNKSELSLGYFTKYGDGACDLEPIADLFKTEIFELAKYLQIPRTIIDKKPTAGLWENQSDESEFGFTYADLDKYLQGQILDPETELKIKNLIKNSEHKRHLPPIISIE